MLWFRAPEKVYFKKEFTYDFYHKTLRQEFYSCLLFYFSGNRLLSFLSTTANAVTTIRPVSTHDIG